MVFADILRKTKIQRLITTNSQDSETIIPSRGNIQNIYKGFYTLNTHTFQTIVFSFLVFLVPTMTNAGVFSFVQNLFVTKLEAEQFPYHNSQNIPLLEASLSPDPDADKGGPEITFNEDETSIVAESGLLSLLPGEYISTSGTEESLYVVRPGDTLSDIADKFGVKTETIRWRNSIGAKEYVRAGQELQIPPVDGFYYKIAKGDTLSTVAKKHAGDIDTIKTFNKISDSEMKIGNEIFIPGGKQAIVAPVSSPSKSTANSTPAKAKVILSAPSQISEDKLGSWIWPVNGGIVTQGYGNTSFAGRSGYYKGDFHGGVDIGAARGTEVLAAKAGEVTLSKTGYNGGYGNYVIITHEDGTSTRYGHNTKNLVKVGQKVVQGQVIATVGSTGRATGPHVHFEIRDANGKQMDHNIFYDTYRNY